MRTVLMACACLLTVPSAANSQTNSWFRVGYAHDARAGSASGGILASLAVTRAYGKVRWGIEGGIAWLGTTSGSTFLSGGSTAYSHARALIFLGPTVVAPFRGRNSRGVLAFGVAGYFLTTKLNESTYDSVNMFTSVGSASSSRVGIGPNASVLWRVVTLETTWSLHVVARADLAITTPLSNGTTTAFFVIPEPQHGIELHPILSVAVVFRSRPLPVDYR